MNRTSKIKSTAVLLSLVLLIGSIAGLSGCGRKDDNLINPRPDATVATTEKGTDKKTDAATQETSKETSTDATTEESAEEVNSEEETTDGDSSSADNNSSGGSTDAPTDGGGSGSDNGSSQEEIYIVDWVQEYGSPQVTSYLGATRTVTPVNNYAVYSDGSRELIHSSEEVTTSSDGYGATDDQLQAFSQSYASSYRGYYEQVLVLVNQIRAEAGVDPVVLDDTLCLAATMRSVEMDLKNYFAHSRADGSDVFSIFRYFGYAGMMGENIAAGYSSPEAVVEGWKNSPGHYSNMITSEFTRMGVGYSNLGFGDWHNYWTQLFHS